MAKTANDYLKLMYEARNKSADEGLKKYQAQADLTKKQALTTKKSEGTSALQDYYKYINPYGVQAEALGNKGLSNSGLSQTSLSKGWANYQNRLGQANSAYQNTLTQADTNMYGYQANVSAQKQSNAADYYQNLYTQALNKELASGSSGGSRSGRRSGGSSSSGITKTSTPLESLSSGKGYAGVLGTSSASTTKNKKSTTKNTSKNKTATQNITEALNKNVMNMGSNSILWW